MRQAIQRGVASRVAGRVTSRHGRSPTEWRRDLIEDDEEPLQQNDAGVARGHVRWFKDSVLALDRGSRNKLKKRTNKRRGFEWAAVGVVCAVAVSLGVPQLLMGLVGLILRYLGWSLVALLSVLFFSMFFPRLLGIILTKSLVPVVHGFPLRFEYVHLNLWVTWGVLHVRVKAEGVGFGNPVHFPHYYFLKVRRRLRETFFDFFDHPTPRPCAYACRDHVPLGRR